MHEELSDWLLQGKPVGMLSIGFRQNSSPAISIQSMGKAKKVIFKMKALSIALFE
jgi:hypothetical protein